MIPIATGELEVGGQMELEVYSAGAIIYMRHLDAFGFPVGQF